MEINKGFIVAVITLFAIGLVFGYVGGLSNAGKQPAQTIKQGDNYTINNYNYTQQNIEEKNVTRITLLGVAKGTVASDTAILYISIQNMAQTLEGARANSNERLDGVMKELGSEYGATSDDFSFQSYSEGPTTGYISDSKINDAVTRSFTLRTKKLDKLDEICHIVIENNTNNECYIQELALSDGLRNEIQNQLRDKAILNAKTEAEGMFKVNKPVLIEWAQEGGIAPDQSGNYPYNQYPNADIAMYPGGGYYGMGSNSEMDNTVKEFIKGGAKVQYTVKATFEVPGLEAGS